MVKPKLDKNISLKDFKDFYWLKQELVRFCRELGINSSGGKIDISNRIVSYLESGEVIIKLNSKKSKIVSTFDWNKEKLDLNTRITDSYKNTANVRNFFKQQISSKFKFNVVFIDWMRINKEKTLAEAITKWQEIAKLKKSRSYKIRIAPQFEYNNYIRDFLSANPYLSLRDAINSWKIKRDKPSSKKYEKEDLLYL